MKVTYVCDYCGAKETLDFYYWEADYKDTCSKCKCALKKENSYDSDVFGYNKVTETKLVIKRDVFGYNYKRKK